MEINKYIIIGLFIIGCITGFYGLQLFTQQLTNYLPEGIKLITINPAEVFTTSIMISIAFGIIFILPYLLMLLMKFSWSALYKKEKDLIKKILPLSTILFIFGALFGGVVYLFFGILFFAEFNNSFGLTNMWSYSGIIESLVMMCFVFGIAFQLPIVLYGLVKTRLVKVCDIKKARAGLIVGLLIMSAVITPPDVFSQLIIFIPLYGLFELTVFILGKQNTMEVLA